MWLLCVIIALSVVFFSVTFLLLLFSRKPFIDHHKKEFLKQQSKELTSKPEKGETPIRRHILYPELYETKDSVFSKFKASVQRFKNERCLGTRKVLQVYKEKRTVKGSSKEWDFYELGPYEWITFEEAWNVALDIGCGLRSLGLNANECFAIYEDTRMEWTLTAQGCFSQSLCVLTVYANLGIDALTIALGESEAKFVLTNGRNLELIAAYKYKLPTLKGVIYTDKTESQAIEMAKNLDLIVLSFDELKELGKKHHLPPCPPGAEDVAVLMYTSGSTGVPKGVMITHQNILSSVDGGLRGVSLKFSPEDTYISYLPLAHVLALIVECLCLSQGVAIGYASPRTLVDSEVKNCKGDLRELQPTLLAGVPTVFDRFRKGILDTLRRSPPLFQKLFNIAYGAKLAALQEGRDTPFWNSLIFDKINEQMGGKLKVIISGGAPLSQQTFDFVRVCVCINTLQGYGLTETAGGSTLMMSCDTSPYLTVGPPMPCSEIKLVDVPELHYLSTDIPFPRGEVWVRGSNVSKGYFKNPTLTEDAFKEGGWFATGDIGQWMPNGALQIIDRKKNIVKLSHGEYVALEHLESIFKNAPAVENICICVKSTRSFFVAMVVPSRRYLRDWLLQAGGRELLDQHDGNESEDAMIDERVLSKPEIVQHILSSLNEAGRAAKLKSFETPKYIYLCPDEWTTENGLLTAAQKIKRHEIASRYSSQINTLLDKDNSE